MNEISFRGDALTHPAPLAPEGASFPAEQPAPILVQYLRLVKRWKWLMIGSVAASIIAGLIITLLMTPQYTASTTLEIQRQSDRVVNVQGVEPETNPVDLEFYQTQYGLLRSKELAEQVAIDLRLVDNDEFFALFGEAGRAEDLAARAASGGSARSERTRLAGRILLEHINVDAERLSRLVNVSFTGPDPVLSARIVNAWSRLFIETSLDRRFEATSYARKFLETRLEQLRERLQESERALVGYATSERIINIPTNAQSGGGSGADRSIVAEDLSALNSELNNAIAARVAAQSRLQSQGGQTSEALSNNAISDLRGRRATLSAERSRLLSQFNADYPPAQALSDQIAEIDRSLSREESRVRGTLQGNYEAAATRENALRSQVEGLKTGLLDLRGREIQYNILQREVDTNRQLYDALLQRYKEIGVAGGVGVNNISVVDPGQVPEDPSSPNLIINLLIATILGLAIGVVLALLLDQTNDTISDPRELESQLGIPLLGTVPMSDDRDPLVDVEDIKSPLVESYFSMRTRLAFTTEKGVPQTFAVTSSRPAEGKSTTSYAIARTLARTSRNVLVVDADMRSPSQHEMFGFDNAKGLSNYLSGGENIDSLVRYHEGSSLSLISAGPTPPNAAELLSSDRLARLIEHLSTRFDHIVFDAPPVMGLADTPLISNRVGGCVFVIEAHKTPVSTARVAIERLQAAQGRILGCLLTKFDSKRADYGYGYEYGYGYGETGKTAS